MAYGIIEFNQDGLIKCEICGQYFKRVLGHVRQKHFMTEREYKIYYGFDLKKGITSKESKQKSRDAVMKNYEKCIENNLIKKGNSHRYKKGDAGRTKNMVSEQTRQRLSNLAKTNMTIEKRKELCKELGKSGLGNKARWNKK